MHVGARFAFGGYPVDGSGELPVHQQNSLVTPPHLGNVALYDNRLPVEHGEHLQHRAKVFVIRFDTEHTRTAVSVERFQYDLAVLRAEASDFLPVRRDQRRRHQILEQGNEQLLRRVPHVEGIVDHQRIGVNAF